jgi:biopolymer transport protein ExbD/biopolymer transport protein TolR
MKPEIVRYLTRVRRHGKEAARHAAFESTSIGDLAFLLLSFFIVTSSFILRQGVFFSLPSKNSGAMRVEQRQLLEVFPVNDGFVIDNTLINRKDFSELLQKRNDEMKDSILVVKMAPEVPYARLVDTLSVARETGTTRISLKNTEEGR